LVYAKAKKAIEGQSFNFGIIRDTFDRLPRAAGFIEILDPSEAGRD